MRGLGVGTLYLLVGLSVGCQAPHVAADTGDGAFVGDTPDSGLWDAGLASQEYVDAGTDSVPLDAGEDGGGPDTAIPDAGTPDAGIPPCDPGVASGIEVKCPLRMVCALNLVGGCYTGCASPQYSVSGNMVTDALTGLVWQAGVAPGGASYSWDSTGDDPTSGQYYCATLDLGGYSDWRLPTIAELFSLVDVQMPFGTPSYGTGQIYIDETVFANSGGCWSSTRAQVDGWGWGFNFIGGDLFEAYSGDNRQGEVRCVR